jgi:hypothetical protein
MIGGHLREFNESVLPRQPRAPAIGVKEQVVGKRRELKAFVQLGAARGYAAVVMNDSDVVMAREDLRHRVAVGQVERVALAEGRVGARDDDVADGDHRAIDEEIIVRAFANLFVPRIGRKKRSFLVCAWTSFL